MKQEVKANAQLIATAPELLGCLININELMQRRHIIDSEAFLREWDEQVEKNTNVINKALGDEKV